MKRKLLRLLILPAIRPEYSDIGEVLKAKSLADKTFEGAGSNIVYHFDISNLSKYTFDEVEKILD